MSSVVTAITGGGGTGTAWNAKAINIDKAASDAQAQEQYANAQKGLNNQASFLQAVQAQNGLANQSSVYNQLQGVANGTGPNPAQAMLNQATGANTANQAALMAGQRGSGQNAGLIARQAAMQGGANQQQAAGQGATMQAQQSLGALNQMGGLATQQVGQQANAVGAYTNATQNEQQMILNQITAQNNAEVGMNNSMNAANAGVQAGIANGQMQAVGQITGAAGTAATGMPAGKANGGAVGYADGGDIKSMVMKAAPMLLLAEGTGSIPDVTKSGPKSSVGQYLHDNPITGGDMDGPKALGQGMGKLGAAAGTGINAGVKAIGNMFSSSGEAPAQQASTGASGMKALAEGGKVPVMLSPGEKKLTPAQAKKAAEGKLNPMAEGKTVPGKPVVGGAKNDYANDIVKDEAEPGTMIIPRSITQGKDAHEKSIQFVRDHFAKKGIPMAIFRKSK